LRRKGEPAKTLPELPAIDLSIDAKVAEVWRACVPVESLGTEEFDAVLASFGLAAADLKQEDFARFEARVNEARDQLVFPVR
jgi:hypothetical protein